MGCRDKRHGEVKYLVGDGDLVGRFAHCEQLLGIAGNVCNLAHRVLSHSNYSLELFK